MRNMLVVGTIISALSSQILPQLLFLAVMALGDGVDRLIPFMIFYVASMSGLLVWIYMMSRFGSRRTFLTALIVLAIGLVCFLLPFAAAIEWSAFLIGVGSIGVGSIMTTILSQLKEGKPQSAKGGTGQLVVVLIAWIGLFAYTLSRSYNLAVLLFLLSLLLPWRFVRRLPFEKTATWTLSTPFVCPGVRVVRLLARLLFRIASSGRFHPGPVRQRVYPDDVFEHRACPVICGLWRQQGVRFARHATMEKVRDGRRTKYLDDRVIDVRVDRRPDDQWGCIVRDSA